MASQLSGVHSSVPQKFSISRSFKYPSFSSCETKSGAIQLK